MSRRRDFDSRSMRSKRAPARSRSRPPAPAPVPEAVPLWQVSRREEPGYPPFEELSPVPPAQDVRMPILPIPAGQNVVESFMNGVDSCRMTIDFVRSRGYAVQAEGQSWNGSQISMNLVVGQARRPAPAPAPAPRISGRRSGVELFNSNEFPIRYRTPRGYSRVSRRQSQFHGGTSHQAVYDHSLATRSAPRRTIFDEFTQDNRHPMYHHAGNIPQIRNDRYDVVSRRRYQNRNRVYRPQAVQGGGGGSRRSRVTAYYTPRPTIIQEINQDDQPPLYQRRADSTRASNSERSDSQSRRRHQRS